MFLYYKLIFFFICVVIFSTTAEEYEHSDTEIAKSDDRKSVFIGLIEITISLIGSTSAVMDIWDLSMALAFAVTSAIIGLELFLVSYTSYIFNNTVHIVIYFVEMKFLRESKLAPYSIEECPQLLKEPMI